MAAITVGAYEATSPRTVSEAPFPGGGLAMFAALAAAVQAEQIRQGWCCCRCHGIGAQVPASVKLDTLDKTNIHNEPGLLVCQPCADEWTAASTTMPFIDYVSEGILAGAE